MQREKTKDSEISGWYSKERLTPEERAASMEDIHRWYEKRSALNYRTVPIEIPGKMLAALGKLALDQEVAFSEFVETVFDEYLTQKGIKWEEFLSTRNQKGDI